LRLDRRPLARGPHHTYLAIWLYTGSPRAYVQFLPPGRCLVLQGLTRSAMPTPFATYFGLRDPNRTSFELVPQRDAELFVDLDNLESELQQRLRQVAPKLVIQGDIGTGKTHILRHVERRLSPEHSLQPLYVELGGFGRRSNFRDLYVVVMSRLEALIKPVLVTLAGRRLDTLLERVELLPDVKTVFRHLAHPSDERYSFFRAWILGTGPTPTQARNLGFAGRLFEYADPSALVAIWKFCSEAIVAAQKSRLLLLIDEGEVFSRVVDPDAQAHIGAGLRNLFDAGNQTLGIIVGLNTPDVRQGVHPFLRSDVASRVSPHKIGLRPLESPERIRSFYEKLWQHLSGTPLLPLLNKSAAHLLGQRALQMHAAITAEPRSATVTQRKIVQILDYIGQRAFETATPHPISERALTSWFNLTA